VPLRYAGAHTHRLSGDWSINMQNLPSGRGGRLSKLRKSICAPAGHKIVVADKSQIECRIAAYICGQQSLLDAFASNRDPYAQMATAIFGYEVSKHYHPVQRFIGKTAVLGCGYGCGHQRFFGMVVASARNLGMDMDALREIWDINAADKAVKTYRAMNRQIANAWTALDMVLRTTWTMGIPTVSRFGPVEIGKGYVEGPGYLFMRYENPRFDTGSNTFLYDYAGKTHVMYGAKFLENIVQFLARTNVMHDALRIADRGFPFVLQAHDELAWVVPDDQVRLCMAVALREMRRPPSWAANIPLAAEASYGQSYGDAK